MAASSSVAFVLTQAVSRTAKTTTIARERMAMNSPEQGRVVGHSTIHADEPSSAAPLTPPRATYFTTVSIILLLLSLVAFSDNLFTNVGQPSNRDPKFIVHGLFGLAWYILLVLQTHLVRLRHVRRHRQLGVATMLVALGVTLSTLYIFVVVWKGWSAMAAEVRANRLLLPGYAVCLVLAWLRRGTPEWHKRLIFVGTFFMLGPVLSRAYDPLIVSWLEPLAPRFTARFDEVLFLTFFIGLWVGAFLSLATHDWKTLRRIHPVTAAGFVWLLLAWILSSAT